MIDQAGKGVLVYLDQEGRGIGLINKLRAYKLQDEGHDTVEANQKLGFKADLRDYGIGAQILWDCGVRKMRLMTNNPKKIDGLKQLYDLEVVERVPIEVGQSEHNAEYLQVKRDKMGHLLSLVGGAYRSWQYIPLHRRVSGHGLLPPLRELTSRIRACLTTIFDPCGPRGTRQRAGGSAHRARRLIDRRVYRSLL